MLSVFCIAPSSLLAVLVRIELGDNITGSPVGSFPFHIALSQLNL
jgi:hypothetical protein